MERSYRLICIFLKMNLPKKRGYDILITDMRNGKSGKERNSIMKQYREKSINWISKIVSSKKNFRIFWNCLWAGVFGWTMETVFCSILYHSLQDRGFLSLPFCPIYAVGVFLYLLMGKSPKPSIKNFWRLFFVVAAAGTVFEGFSGLILEQFGIQLWYYEGVFPLSLRYISLPVSIFWGLAGGTYPLLVIPKINRWADSVLPSRRRAWFWWTTLLILGDFLFTCWRVWKNGGYTPLY
jgi:uncharacterized membrane protein